MSCHSFFLMKDNLVIPSLYYPFFLMEVLNHAMSSLLFDERLQIVSYLLGKTCLLTNFLTPFRKTYLLTNFLTPFGKTYSFIIIQIAFPIFVRRSSSKNCFPYFRETFFVKKLLSLFSWDVLHQITSNCFLSFRKDALD